VRSAAHQRVDLSYPEEDYPLTKTTTITVLASIFVLGGAATAQEHKPSGLEKKPGGMPPGHMKKEGGAMPEGGAAMAMPKPSPEWEAFMKGMDGNWKCESTMPAGSMGPGSPEMKMQTTAKVKKDLGGFFLVGNYEVKNTKTVPGMKGTFAMGAPDGKTLVSTNMDSMGNASFTSGPLGPEGGTTTGDGYMMGTKVKLRETVQKKGDKEMNHKVEVDAGKGFMVAVEDNCKK
jgi:hypothetical protein